MRVLEVGAGTGGTRNLIFRYLTERDGSNGRAPPCPLYTFLDLSAGFFDASKSPSEQGLEDREHSCDLIVAANVFHATPYLEKTLLNIRSLMVPDGILLLTEHLLTLKTVNYIFGHFSGWWLGEADGRFGGPLLNAEGWDRGLRCSGFSGADTIIYGAENPYRQIMTIVYHVQAHKASIDDNGKQVVLFCSDKPSLFQIATALKADLESGEH